MRLIEAAHAYADEGWPVFRILPGEKRPYDRWVNGGPTQVSTCAQDEIDRRWRAMPDANIGIATGHRVFEGGRSYLTVLDLDLDEPGAARPDWAISTFEVDTPSGGRHCYYYTAEPVKSQRIAPGVDVKSRGGMVVAAPSITRAGAYKLFGAGWNMPIWLDHVLFRPTVRISSKGRAFKAHANSSFRPAQDSIGEGGRDNYLTAYAGWYIARHDLELEPDPEYDLALALATESIRVCNPLLPEKDLWRIARSIWRKHEKELLNGLV